MTVAQGERVRMFKRLQHELPKPVWLSVSKNECVKCESRRKGEGSPAAADRLTEVGLQRKTRSSLPSRTRASVIEKWRWVVPVPGRRDGVGRVPRRRGGDGRGGSREGVGTGRFRGGESFFFAVVAFS